MLQDVFWQHVEPDGLGVSNRAHQSGATGGDSATLDMLEEPSQSCRTKAGDNQSYLDADMSRNSTVLSHF